MSEYVKYDCSDITDDQTLIEALQAMGWNTNQIEVHQNPVTLYGYHNDARPEKANIVIRRNHVGSVANDIGFLKLDNGSYQPIVSEYDTPTTGPRQRHGSFVDTVKNKYARITGEKCVAQITNTTIPRMKNQGIAGTPRNAQVSTVRVGNQVKIVLKY